MRKFSDVLSNSLNLNALPVPLLRQVLPGGRLADDGKRCQAMYVLLSGDSFEMGGGSGGGLAPDRAGSEAGGFIFRYFRCCFSRLFLVSLLCALFGH